MRASQRATRVWAAALATAFSLGLAAPPPAASAAEGQRSRPVPLSVSAAALVDRADTALAVQDAAAPALAQEAPAAEPPKAFWKSGRGIATAVLLAAGLGWVIYSTSHDRVRSPVNQ